MKGHRLKTFMVMMITFMVYSSSSIFGKLASLQEFPSFPYIFYFGCVIVSMGVYAILWQKILTIMPLNKAFLCKSITIVMILGVSSLYFEESVSMNNILGTASIMVGLGVLAWE